MKSAQLHIVRPVFLVLFLALIQACNVTKVRSSHNLLDGEILSVVHACGGFETFRNNVPDNTVEALERSLAQGADGIEFDLQMTADSQLVAFHDADLSKATTCTGCIHAKTLAEVKECRYKTRNGSLDGDYEIPTFAELLTVFSGHSRPVWMFANTKHFTSCEPEDLGQFYPLFAGKILRLVESHGLQEQFVLESLDADFLMAARNIQPNAQLLFDDEDFERGMQVVREHQFLGLAISNSAVTEDQVKAAHLENFWLGIWGVKVLEGTKKAVKKGPEFIMTDDLQMLQGQLEE